MGTRTCTVTFRDPRGGLYGHTTMGDSLFEVVSNAIEFFESGFWRGARPLPTTVFSVSLVGEQRKYLVSAESIHRWRECMALIERFRRVPFRGYVRAASLAA